VSIPRFRVSNLLWATFWIATTFGAFEWMTHNDPSSGLGIILGPLLIASPFAAVGAIYGRMWKGLLIGAAATAILFAVCLPFVEARR
jgi:hypothetical protein